ncbi:hypothetical protein HZF05_13915 [Sphingomonas sp. CGMCC 1.13654]|uniref:Uncharacterized protein n=1 Tax=Sphingomonas chungangi TaxID=2683589 RepID=A0A838L8U6_9SPHN|nr:hypothetical protein [Sphingomonas chungangi]MBA2935182.1 hypothetical protein [Sphingomonas chungangi]MVW55260.1 hypothetical protein [Sphingomonas chungangi]
MTSESDDRHIHSELNLLGFRSRAAVVGLLQLTKELRQTGLLDDAATNRVRDAVVDELALMRPRHGTSAERRESLRKRLDALIGA